MAKAESQPFTPADEQHYTRILRVAVDVPAAMRIDGANLDIYADLLNRLIQLLIEELDRIGRDVS